jgi:hypothetical protein
MNQFPIKENHYDCAGNQLVFEIDCLSLGDFYLITATEITEFNREGYEFSSISYSTVQALGNVRKKIGEGISIKYLSQDPNVFGLNVNKAKGRVADDGLIIDGSHVSFEQLQSLFSEYAGFEFELRFKDKSE